MALTTTSSNLQTFNSNRRFQRSISESDAVAQEKILYDRWGKLFKTKNKNGNLTRTDGSRNDFDRFMSQMMPDDVSFEWGRNEDTNLITITVSQNGSQLFYKEGRLREIFESLFNHYSNHRSEYFEQKYHVKFPKKTFEQIYSNGSNPHEPEIIEVEKEVIKEVIKEVVVEVPSKKTSTEMEMEKVYEVVMNSIDGNKKIPNKFRHIKDFDLNLNMTGIMELRIKLGP